ncbi:MAG: hypothetical protein AAF702_35750 [Chloroflexota bacterium]
MNWGKFRFGLSLNQAHQLILVHLAKGDILKAHRDIDGGKAYRLHLLDGTVLQPSAKIVNQLKSARYIDSNKKFPAATYLLTDRGLKVIDQMEIETSALSARNHLPPTCGEV